MGYTQTPFLELYYISEIQILSTGCRSLASSASLTEQQRSARSEPFPVPSDNSFRLIPITSYPCSWSRAAATALSTPPLIATTTLGLRLTDFALVFYAFTGPVLYTLTRASTGSARMKKDQCFQ